MEIQKNRITFLVAIKAERCNPNGDPLNSNLPRMSLDGLGEMSDVCLKRKIRDALEYAGYEIFVSKDNIAIQENDNSEYLTSLSAKAKSIITDEMKKNAEKIKNAASKKWIDVRAFGQVFPFKGDGKGPVTCSVRGCVSIGCAYSIAPIDIENMQITKCVNWLEGYQNKSSDTIGMKSMIDHGIYIAYGGISPQLAELNGFTVDDVDAIKNAIINMMEYSISASRPAGSLEVCDLFWWEDIPNKKHYNVSKIVKSVKFIPKDDYPYYEIERPYTLDEIKEEHISFL